MQGTPAPWPGPMLIARLLRFALVAGAVAVLGLAAILVATAGLGWPLALALALVLVPAGFALVLGIEFVASTVLGDRSWRGIGRAWLSEIAASMRTFLVAIPLHRRHALRSGTGHGLPVVLVHGYFCNGAVWRPLARHLAGAGHPVVAIDLERTFGSIDRHAATIARAVAAVGDGPRPVVLVGHSMGGLAIRAYLRQAGSAGIAGVVTLGSPHRGTHAAFLGHSRAARQMRCDSRWLAALERDERGTSLPPVTVVISENDNIVYPQRGQVLAGARVLQLRGVGHLALVYDAAAWRLVDGAIARFAAMPVDPAGQPWAAATPGP